MKKIIALVTLTSIMLVSLASVAYAVDSTDKWDTSKGYCVGKTSMWVAGTTSTQKYFGMAARTTNTDYNNASKVAYQLAVQVFSSTGGWKDSGKKTTYNVSTIPTGNYYTGWVSKTTTGSCSGEFWDRPTSAMTLRWYGELNVACY